MVATTSCQFFETEKLNTETLYQEEVKTIDWKNVDQYPLFATCEMESEKAAQKKCFESTLASQLISAIQHKKITTVHTLQDTIILQIEITKNAKVRARGVRVDTVLFSEIPQLKDWILQSIDSLQLIAPAYKRGIPVATNFEFPVVFRTISTSKN
ncbi:MAG: hypothetical protein HKM28_00980 [Flavobacteriaceae bacterium]|nr:hypothetical protein [Flavobacteriaceae bacterium]